MRRMVRKYGRVGEWASLTGQLANTLTRKLLTCLLAVGFLALAAPNTYSLHYFGGSGDGSASRTMVVVTGAPAAVGALYVQLQADNETLIKEDDQYIGQYVYMTSGVNINKCYLIVDSDERTTAADGTDVDTLTIFPNLFSGTITDGFAAGDSFVVIDRIYNEKSYTTANFNLTKSGALNNQWITWTNNGLSVVDAENEKAYNVFADTGLNAVRLSDSIKFLNYTNTTPNSPNPLWIGGTLIMDNTGGYYNWGDASSPTGLGSFAVSSYNAATVTLTWAAATDNHWTEAGTGHYEIWYGTAGPLVVQGAPYTEWDDSNDNPGVGTGLDISATTTTTITGLTEGALYYFKIWAIDDNGNQATTTYASQQTNTKPFGGYSAAAGDNVIPAAQCAQATNGSGVITISFRIKDANADNCTLKTFQYSVDGTNFTAPTNGDNSGCLKAANGTSYWKTNGTVSGSYASAADWTGTIYTFTFDTQHADLNDLAGVDQSDIRVRFTVNDARDDSVLPATSAVFRVDNAVPAAPTGVSITGVGSPVLSGYLNTYNTNFTAAAAITAGQVTDSSNAGVAELLIDDSSFGTQILDSSIAVGDTSVSFSAGLTLNSQVRNAVSEGSHTFSVKVTDHFGNTSTSSVSNPSMIADYTVPVFAGIIGKNETTLNQITFSWTAATDTNWTDDNAASDKGRYEVWYDTTAGISRGGDTESSWVYTNNITLDNRATTGVTVNSGIKQSTLYYYNVFAIDDAGNISSMTEGSVTTYGFRFIAPVSGTIWAAGSTQTIEWAAVTGMAAPFTVQYWHSGMLWWYNVIDSLGRDAVSVSGTTQEWKMPVNLPIGTGQKIKIIENSNFALENAGNPNYQTHYNDSDIFNASGGLTVEEPHTYSVGPPVILASNWSRNTAHTIQWIEAGTFSSGVKLEYYSSAGVWTAITGGGANNAGIIGTIVSNNINGTTTKSFSWTPSVEAGITAGYASADVRVSDANTSNPIVRDPSGSFTIANIDSLTYTPPDRTFTAVSVGTTNQTISWAQAGLTKIQLQYYSNKKDNYTGGYEIIITPQDASNLDASIRSFPWTVPNDVGVNNVYIKAIAVGVDGAEGTSGIEGAVSKIISTPFTIYGAISLTSSYNGATYQVDTITNRVPVTWAASSSIEGFVFEYTESRITVPIVFNTITSVQGNFYTTATGSTVGYNWTRNGSGTGTAYWHPLVTRNTIWLRIKDTNDTSTVSSLGAAEDYFKVSGVSITSPLSADSPFVVGQSFNISGKGAGAVTVALYYATSLSDAQTKTGSIMPIGSTSVTGDDYTIGWTVQDVINATVHFRAENIANTTIYGTGGPYIVKGVVKITNPTDTDWVVGETTNDISGTVTGDIDYITLQYANSASPAETDWFNLTSAAVYIGNKSGTSPQAWTLADSFTVLDVVTSTFKIRAIDGTGGRESAIIAKSAAITNTVTVRGALSIDTPASDWYAHKAYDVTWNVTGNIGNVKIQYQTSKDDGVTDPYTLWDAGIVVELTASDWTANQGITPQGGSFTWDPVVDAVLAEVGAGNIQPVPPTNPVGDPDVYMKLKIMDADDTANVFAVSNAFVVKYRAIIWRVHDCGGNDVLSLTVAEGATTTPTKAAWSTTGYSGSDTIRYYPDNGDTGDQAYTTDFSRVESGTNYSKTVSGWRADSDNKIMSATILTASCSAATVEIVANYNDTNDAIDAMVWLTQRGVIVENVNDGDLTGISFNVYNSAGTQINAVDLGAGISVSASNVFSGISYDPATGIDSNQSYTLEAVITHQGQEYKGLTAFRLPTTYNYEVIIGTSYISTTDSLKINTWLTRSGVSVGRPGDLTLTIYDTSGDAAIYTKAVDGYDGSADNTKGEELDTTGIYKLEWDPIAISIAEIYSIKAQITYQGNDYSAITTFSKGVYSEIAAVGTQVSSVVSSVGATLSSQVRGVSTSVETVRGDISTVGSSIGARVTAVGSSVTSILQETSTTLPARIVSESLKGVQTQILNRPTAVISGQTATIRFKTTSGLKPKISVYDADNKLKVTSQAMTEIGSTGIYEYDVVTQAAWGTGDFTVVCTESAQSATDSMVLTVATESDIEAALADVETGATSASTYAMLAKQAADTAASKIDQISISTTNASSQAASLKQILSSMVSLKSDISTVSARTAETSGRISAIESKVSGLSADMAVGAAKETESFSSAGLAKSDEITLLNNKMEEVKAVIDLLNSLIEKPGEEPVTTFWFEEE